MGKKYNLFKCIDSINIKQIILNRQQKQKPFCQQSLLWETHRPSLCTSCCTLVCRSDTSKRLFLHPLIIQPSLWVHCGYHTISWAFAVINCSFIHPVTASKTHAANISRIPKPSLHRAGEVKLCPWCQFTLALNYKEGKKYHLSHTLFTNFFLKGTSPHNKGSDSLWGVSV